MPCSSSACSSLALTRTERCTASTCGRSPPLPVLRHWPCSCRRSPHPVRPGGTGWGLHRRLNTCNLACSAIAGAQGRASPNAAADHTPSSAMHCPRLSAARRPPLRALRPSWSASGLWGPRLFRQQPLRPQALSSCGASRLGPFRAGRPCRLCPLLQMHCCPA